MNNTRIIENPDGSVEFIINYPNGQPYQKFRCDSGNRLQSYNDLPAQIEYYDTGDVKILYWAEQSIFHRDTGPAYIKYNTFGYKEYEAYFINGQLHCEYQPAETRYQPQFEEHWYIRNKDITDEVNAWLYENDFIVPLTKSEQVLFKLRFM